MLEMMLEKREEKAEYLLAPKKGSATRTLTGAGFSNEDWIANGDGKAGANGRK